MKLKKSIILPLALAFAIRSGTTLNAAEPDPQEAAIIKTAEAFVEAFHKGDAKAVAAFWTPDGDYVDDSGRVLKGREAIEKSFAELFTANKGLKVHIDVANIKFPTPDLAIEDGTSAVIDPDGSAPSRARYTNVLVKKDGQWLLSSVREAADAGPSNYELLRSLEWTIGEWIDDAARRGNRPHQLQHGRQGELHRLDPHGGLQGRAALADHAVDRVGCGGETNSFLELSGRRRLWREHLDKGRQQVGHQVGVHPRGRQQGHLDQHRLTWRRRHADMAVQGSKGERQGTPGHKGSENETHPMTAPA